MKTTPGKMGRRRQGVSWISVVNETTLGGGCRLLMCVGMLMLLVPGGMTTVDICSGTAIISNQRNARPNTSPQQPQKVPNTNKGFVSNQDFPDTTSMLSGPGQCSCNFSSLHQTALLSLKFLLESDFPDMCDPVLLLMPYQICPAPRVNRSLNILIPPNEKILLTFNNPNHVRHRLLVTYSAERVLEVECGPTSYVDLPPILPPGRGYDVTPTPVSGGTGNEERSYPAAIIASIVIAVVVTTLIIAAIIRWRFVVEEHKKAKSLGNHIDDTHIGDNPAYQHTPKSSVLDFRTPSIASLAGVGKDVQPRQAPLTGIGSLAAHSEPRLPTVSSVVNGGPIANGHQLGRDPNGGLYGKVPPPSGIPSVHDGDIPDTGGNMYEEPIPLVKNSQGYPDYNGNPPHKNGHPGAGVHPKRGPKQKHKPRHGGNKDPPIQSDRSSPHQQQPRGPHEGYPNYAYDPNQEAPQPPPQYSQPLGALPSHISSHEPKPSPNTDPMTGRPITPPRGASTRPTGSTKPSGPFKEAETAPSDIELAMKIAMDSRKAGYACAYCDQVESRYGRIICHVVREHPDEDLSYHCIDPHDPDRGSIFNPFYKDGACVSMERDNSVSFHHSTPGVARDGGQTTTAFTGTETPLKYNERLRDAVIPGVIRSQLREINLTPTLDACLQLSSLSPTPSVTSGSLPSPLASPPPTPSPDQRSLSPNSRYTQSPRALIATPSPDTLKGPKGGVLNLIKFFSGKNRENVQGCVPTGDINQKVGANYGGAEEPENTAHKMEANKKVGEKSRLFHGRRYENDDIAKRLTLNHATEHSSSPDHHYENIEPPTTNGHVYTTLSDNTRDREDAHVYEMPTCHTINKTAPRPKKRNSKAGDRKSPKSTNCSSKNKPIGKLISPDKPMTSKRKSLNALAALETKVKRKGSFLKKRKGSQEQSLIDEDGYDIPIDVCNSVVNGDDISPNVNTQNNTSPAPQRWFGRSLSYTSDIPLNVY